jgi:hypothetical protein
MAGSANTGVDAWGTLGRPRQRRVTTGRLQDVRIARPESKPGLRETRAPNMVEIPTFAV